MIKMLKLGRMNIANAARLGLMRKPQLMNLYWESTQKCNLKCKHCFNDSGEKNDPDELTADEIKKELYKIAVRKKNKENTPYPEEKSNIGFVCGIVIAITAWVALLIMKITFTYVVAYISYFLLFFIIPLTLVIMVFTKIIRKTNRIENVEKKKIRSIITGSVMAVALFIAVLLIKRFFAGDFAPPSGS